MSLKEISRRWKGCRRCSLCIPRTKIVFGSKFGAPNPDRWTPFILVVGDVPSEDDDATGRPFSGKMGEVVRHDYLTLGGVEFAFLTNVVACHTGGRSARAREKDTCALRLTELIEHLQPDGIIAIGTVAYSQLCNMNLDGRIESTPVGTIVRPEFLLKQRGPRAQRSIKAQASRIQLLVNHLRDTHAGVVSAAPRLHPHVPQGKGSNGP